MPEAPVVKLSFAPVRASERWEPPIKTYPSDAGWDLTVSRFVAVPRLGRALIPTNLAIALPAGFFGLIVSRGATFHAKGLVLHTGTIDPSYRGELLIAVYNPGNRGIHVHEGERIAQLIVLPLAGVGMQAVEAREKLPQASDKRKDGNFGSTGGLLKQNEAATAGGSEGGLP